MRKVVDNSIVIHNNSLVQNYFFANFSKKATFLKIVFSAILVVYETQGLFCLVDFTTSYSGTGF